MICIPNRGGQRRKKAEEPHAPPPTFDLQPEHIIRALHRCFTVPDNANSDCLRNTMQLIAIYIS